MRQTKETKPSGEPKPTIKGYKVFDEDFTCKGMKFVENKTFEVSLPIKICNHGLHFCTKASHCFSYYSFDPKNIVCEVEALGETQTHDEDSKVCTNILRVGRRLTWQEVLVVANEGKNNTGHSNSGDSNSGDRNSGDSNSGDRNSGDSNSGNWNSGNSNSGNWNSGDRNSGDRNSGDRNSGYWNSGDSNSGYWNSGDSNSGDSNSGYRNSGAFCIDNNPKIYLFDKPTDILVRDWEHSEVVRTMRELLNTTIWVLSSDMSEEDKKKHPTHSATGGYLKVKTMHEAWRDMWGNLSDKKKKLFTDLPNFDAEKFKIITGIEVTEKPTN
jgi:hypothetical protein